MIEWSQKNKVEVTFELVSQTFDDFNSPVFESEIVIEGIHACKGKGYSKKESQQEAAHLTLNKIKKDSAFVESIFAAKALREEPLEAMPALPEEEKPQVVVPMPEAEVYRRSDDMEEIIRAAEEAAYAER